MADAKLTFDADTAAYNAKLDESHKKNEKLVESFKGMAEPLLKVASVAGAIEVAIEAIESRWEKWRENVEKAGVEAKKVGTDLAAVVGAAGLLPQYAEIKKGVQESKGVLSTEQKSQAISNFAGALPGLTADQAILALNQTQKAAQVIGPENIGTFAQALGLAMQSGLSQQKAGDVAIAVSQSGAHGLEAFQRAAGHFASEYTTPEARSKADFLKYVENAGTDVFGTRPTQVLGGQAVQRRLGRLRSGELDQSSASAAAVDPELAREREIQARQADTETAREEKYGNRAVSEEELDSLKAGRRARGGSFFDLPEFLLQDEAVKARAAGLKQDEQAAAGIQPGGTTRGNALREFARARAIEQFGSGGGPQVDARASEIMIEVLKGIHHNTREKAGAAKFRNEAQDRDKGEEE